MKVAFIKHTDLGNVYKISTDDNSVIVYCSDCDYDEAVREIKDVENRD